MTAKFVPRELLDPIFAYFHPRRVILFRFKAQGTAGPDSDIDLLVELDDDFPPDGFSAKPLRRPRYSEPVDIIPYRASVLASRAHPAILWSSQASAGAVGD
ncbi:MAG: uncharacterized protein JWM91_3409 [Rhodospirillales bacterium]|nr:uncharacterized protein [Rhodospirillales bacterium]